jgi:hypothetical protein
MFRPRIVSVVYFVRCIRIVKNVLRYSTLLFPAVTDAKKIAIRLLRTSCDTFTRNFLKIFSACIRKCTGDSIRLEMVVCNVVRTPFVVNIQNVTHRGVLLFWSAIHIYSYLNRHHDWAFFSDEPWHHTQMAFCEYQFTTNHVWSENHVIHIANA